MATVIQDLYVHRGQSVWLNNVSHSLLNNRTMKDYVHAGLRGIHFTFNTLAEELRTPSFNAHITAARSDHETTEEILDELIIDDVQKAADTVFHIYDVTKGFDGYVAVDVNPHLVDNPKEFAKECIRLFKQVRRPNVMFNVPACDNLFNPIENLLADGININVTHIFSQKQYIEASHSYLRGLKRFTMSGGIPRTLCSIASVHIQPMNTILDKVISEALAQEQNDATKHHLSSMQGNGIVTTCAIIYKTFRELFSSQEFNEVQQKGITHIQRLLWNTTHFTNNTTPDTEFVTNGLTHNTINLLATNAFEELLELNALPDDVPVNSAYAQEMCDFQEEFTDQLHEECKSILKDNIAAMKKTYDTIIARIEKKK